ncbi:MAG: hypothetical protein ACREJX_12025, partial [Polyangiaceae bacterium]
RIMIAFGSAMFGAAAWMMGGFDQNVGYWQFFWPRAWQGFALGFLFVPLSTATLAGLAPREIPNASGIYTLLRQLGGSVGIALLTTLLARHEAMVQTALSSGINIASPAVRSYLQTHPNGLMQLYGYVVQNTAVISYDYLFRFSGILFFIAIPSVLLLRPTKGGVARGGAVAE